MAVGASPGLRLQCGAMDITYHYSTLQTEDDAAGYARVAALAFGGERDKVREWLDAYSAHARIVRHDDAVVGGLVTIPMGQFFGHQRVTMIGVAGVAVAPEARGRGAATTLMQSALRRLYRAGAALSTLYPAIHGLYRQVGYEIAGGQYRVRVPARGIGVIDRSLTVRAMEKGDMRSVRTLYRTCASTRPGWLDRGDYIWDRVTGHSRKRDDPAFVVVGDKGIEGYVIYHQKSNGEWYDLEISGLVGRTPQASMRLLGFLADHRSLARDIVWYGGVDDPMLSLLPERGARVELAEPWMLRIVHVENALAERGYPRGISARLDLEVHDDTLRGNRGKYILDVDGGKGQVKTGGRGLLQLDVRALAALYSGHMSPHRLVELGAVKGSPRAIATAATIFAGPPPSLRDFF